MNKPQTRYAKSGDVHIAYQIIGDGPVDLIYVPGFISHIGYAWEQPSYARFLRRLGSFSRLIWFDKRGTGLSDRVGIAPLEQRMDDVRAVMDAAGSNRAVLLGESEGGPMSMLFAASYPDRTVGLILYATFARRVWAPDYPWAATAEEREAYCQHVERDWGNEDAGDLLTTLPSVAGDPRYRKWFSEYERFSASPGAAAAIARMNSEIDVRLVLPVINVPTIVLHRTGDLDVNIEDGRYLASHIRGARLVELSGVDHDQWLGDAESILGEIEEFVTGSRTTAEPDRVLATVLFTDIVGSTERAVALGDQRWRELLQAHDAAVRREIAIAEGRVIKTAGDGFLVTFGGPARAIRCAAAIVSSVRSLGLEIRAGLHTGECEIMGSDVGGIAVHIGARVAARAAAGQVLVSAAVPPLVAGSGLRFEDLGLHDLKGIPGPQRLYRVIV
jgi:class 3 adenylate cyclase